MNERIRELAEEAGFENGHQDRNGNSLSGELEKFAELIVQECIDIVSPYAIGMENFDGGHPIADLKKHFGVEE